MKGCGLIPPPVFTRASARLSDEKPATAVRPSRENVSNTKAEDPLTTSGREEHKGPSHVQQEHDPSCTPRSISRAAPIFKSYLHR
jgi:hypothetical protein